MTDEFVEYAISYDYIPSSTLHLKDLCFQCSKGIEIDSFALYFKPYEGPTSYEKTSIRVDDPAGIRFRASVTETERGNSDLTEYGFIVTTEALLTAKSVEASNFTFDTDVTKVTGANYQVVDGEVKTDKIFSTEGNVTNFTAIIYNIPAEAYTQNLVVRPYIKFGSDIYYGNPMIDNIAAVAERIKTNSPEEYAANQLAYDNILAGKPINAQN